MRVSKAELIEEMRKYKAEKAREKPLL